MLYQDLLLHNNLQAGVRTLAAAKVVQIITVRKRELKIKKNELSSSLLFFFLCSFQHLVAKRFCIIYFFFHLPAMAAMATLLVVPCSDSSYWAENLVSW